MTGARTGVVKFVMNMTKLILFPPVSKLNTFFYCDNPTLSQIPKEMVEDRGVLLTTFYKKYCR